MVHMSVWARLVPVSWSPAHPLAGYRPSELMATNLSCELLRRLDHLKRQVRPGLPFFRWRDDGGHHELGTGEQQADEQGRDGKEKQGPHRRGRSHFDALESGIGPARGLWQGDVFIYIGELVWAGIGWLSDCGVVRRVGVLSAAVGIEAYPAGRRAAVHLRRLQIQSSPLAGECRDSSFTAIFAARRELPPWGLGMHLKCILPAVFKSTRLGVSINKPQQSTWIFLRECEQCEHRMEGPRGTSRAK